MNDSASVRVERTRNLDVKETQSNIKMQKLISNQDLEMSRVSAGGNYPEMLLLKSDDSNSLNETLPEFGRHQTNMFTPKDHYSNIQNKKRKNKMVRSAEQRSGNRTSLFSKTGSTQICVSRDPSRERGSIAKSPSQKSEEK